MKQTSKLSLLCSTFFILFSCSQVTPINQEINTSHEVIKLKEAAVSNSKVYVAEVSKEKGASLFVNIQSAKNGLSVKASSDGTPAKVGSDIDHYLIYLIKNTSNTTYPVGGDPIGDKVAGPFTINNNGSSTMMKFEGVPPSGSSRYYVAVRAKDSSDNDIIKDNNGSATAWTGSTVGALGIAVSSGGASVSLTYQVTPSATLSIQPNLLDAIGAVIESNIEPNNGADVSNSSIVGSEL